METLPIRSKRELLESFERIVPFKYQVSRDTPAAAVTRTSPYLTHGVIGVSDFASSLLSRFSLSQCDHLLRELMWREYFAHVAYHKREAIFEDMNSLDSSQNARHILPDRLLSPSLPGTDPWFQEIVRTIRTTGYLHKHARMWLASYLVHHCGLHWRKLADWGYYYLYDGDLAINCLSWQWVAGTFGDSPCFFTSENLSRYSGFFSQDFFREFDIVLSEITDSSRGNPFAHDADARETLVSAMPKYSHISVLEGKHVLVLTPWSLREELVRSSRWDYVYLVFDEAFFKMFPWGSHRFRFVEEYARRLGAKMVRGSLWDLLYGFSGNLLVIPDTLNPIYREAIEGNASRQEIHVVNLEPRIHHGFKKAYAESFSEFLEGVDWGDVSDRFSRKGS